MKKDNVLRQPKEGAAGRKSTLIEDSIHDQLRTWVKNLPPLPPGYVYEFIPGEPKYNPEICGYEMTMEAKPIQKYIIKSKKIG